MGKQEKKRCDDDISAHAYARKRSFVGGAAKSMHFAGRRFVRVDVSLPACVRVCVGMCACVSVLTARLATAECCRSLLVGPFEFSQSPSDARVQCSRWVTNISTDVYTSR